MHHLHCAIRRSILPDQAPAQHVYPSSHPSHATTLSITEFKFPFGCRPKLGSISWETWLSGTEICCRKIPCQSHDFPSACNLSCKLLSPTIPFDSFPFHFLHVGLHHPLPLTQSSSLHSPHVGLFLRSYDNLASLSCLHVGFRYSFALD